MEQLHQFRVAGKGEPPVMTESIVFQRLLDIGLHLFRGGNEDFRLPLFLHRKPLCVGGQFPHGDAAEDRGVAVHSCHKEAGDLPLRV